MSDPGDRWKKPGAEPAASAEATGGCEAPSSRRLFLPYTYVAGRLLIVVPTLLIVVLLCAGFAGWGPGHKLHGAAAVPAANWATNKQPEPQEHQQKKHHHKKKAKHKKQHHKHHHQKGKKKPQQKEGQSG